MEIYISSKRAVKFLILFSLYLGTLYSTTAADTWGTFALVLASSQTAVSALGTLLFLITALNSGVRRSVALNALWILFYFGLIACIQFAAHSLVGLEVIFLYFVNALFFFIVVPAMLLADEEFFLDFLRLVVWICSVLVAFSLISLFSNSFLSIPFYVKEEYARFTGFPAVAGIYEHPSHVAIIFSYGLTSATYLFFHGRSRIHVFAALTILVGIVLSQGRVGYLFLVFFSLPFLYQLYRSLHSFGRLLFLSALALLVPILFLVGIYGHETLLNVFRVSEGSAGRFGAWQFAFEMVKESPFAGYGQGSPSQITSAYSEILRLQYGSGMDGVGFHNTFINFAVEFGTLPPLLLFVLFALAYIKIRRAKDGVISFFSFWMLFVSFVAITFVGMSIGGVRIHSMLFTVFLGFAMLQERPRIVKSRPSDIGHSGTIFFHSK